MKLSHYTVSMSPVFAALLAATVSVSCPLQALSDEEDSLENRIRRAEEKYTLKDYRGCREDYQKAYEAGAKPWVLFNKAVCTEESGHYKEAISTYEQYLKIENEPEEYRSLVDAAAGKIAVLTQKLARLVIEDAPQNAVVEINGAPVADWQETPILLDPEDVVVTITCKGYRPLQKALKLRLGTEMFWPVTLVPIPEKTVVYVACDEKKSLVYMDRKLVGSCPANHAVLSGRHALKVEARWKRDFEKRFTVKKGNPITIPVELVPNRGFGEGITTIVLGTITIGVGGVLTVFRHDYLDIAKQYRLKDNQDNNVLVSKNLVSEQSKYKSKANELLLGMITCYALGGSLVATGAGFIFYFLLNNIKGVKGYALSTHSSNLVITF